jgi:hypothetical protein
MMKQKISNIAFFATVAVAVDLVACSLYIPQVVTPTK